MFKHRSAIATLSFAMLLTACGQPPTQPAKPPVQSSPRAIAPLSLQLYIGNERGDNLPVPSAEQAPQAIPVVRAQGFPTVGDLSFSQATYTMRVINNPERWYFTAAFRVTNNTDAPLQNLTMIARSRATPSIGGTSLSKI